jgi:leucyl/phenylalanyl-tRNA--protein transferase
MSPSTFPDPRTYDFPEWVLHGEYFYKAGDIISFGDPLTPENVKEAYRKGIFPWNIERMPLPWFCPERRAILEFADLHIPRSLKKERKKQPFTFTIDRDFDAVIRACAESKREGQRGRTWITDDFIRVYRQPNASKLALLFLIDHLRSRGSTWLDVQVMTEHMNVFGAKEIQRSKFLDYLSKTQNHNLHLF